MIQVNQWSPVTGGFFLIDKPTGWTSFDVVNKMRARLRILSKDKKIKVPNFDRFRMLLGLAVLAIIGLIVFIIFEKLPFGPTFLP